MVDNNILEKAIIFAAKKHAGQKRKGNESPYILHPARVMAILYSVKASRNLNLLMSVCILHDTVEDCGARLSEIAKRFGHQVAGCVEELTTDNEECKRMGKAAYLSAKMQKMSSYSLCVKLADRLDNIRDMDGLPVETRYKTIKDTLIIIEALNQRKLTKTHEKLISLIRKELFFALPPAENELFKMCQSNWTIFIQNYLGHKDEESFKRKAKGNYLLYLYCCMQIAELESIRAFGMGERMYYEKIFERIEKAVFGEEDEKNPALNSKRRVKEGSET